MPQVHPVFIYSVIRTSNPSCLIWRGDCLINWQSGYIFEADGAISSTGVSYAYRFDAAVQSPCGRYVVIYERTGTKGLVLREGSLIREIARSYYCADAYDFPVTLFELPDGRPAIAHCPLEYNQLQIDLLDSGERLTPRAQSESFNASDFFHSGLAVDPSGEWLMSAGWVWHPSHEVCFFPLRKALQDPSILDRGGAGVSHNAEIPSAAFLGPDLAVLASDPSAEAFDEETRDPSAKPEGVLGIYQPSSKTWKGQINISEPLGKIFAVDDDHIISIYRHPKLVRISTGSVLADWPHIDSGAQLGCVSGYMDLPNVSWDPIRKRLAVASEDRIHILKFAAETPE